MSRGVILTARTAGQLRQQLDRPPPRPPTEHRPTPGRQVVFATVTAADAGGGWHPATVKVALADGTLDEQAAAAEVRHPGGEPLFFDGDAERTYPVIRTGDGPDGKPRYLALALLYDGEVEFDVPVAFGQDPDSVECQLIPTQWETYRITGLPAWAEIEPADGDGPDGFTGTI